MRLMVQSPYWPRPPAAAAPRWPNHGKLAALRQTQATGGAVGGKLPQAGWTDLV